jgi:hypothetical protein
MVAIQHLVDVPAPVLDVAAAREQVALLQHGLPTTALATRPEDLRRLARRALDAERAAFRRRAKVGDEPLLDDVAAAAAVDAHLAVRLARAGVAAASSDGMRWLAMGNAWGVAGLVAAGVMVVRAGYEPMAAPVYAAVIGGATGPLATAMLALTRRSFASMKVASATVAWAKALAATGFETMGQLAARRIARQAWLRRTHEAAIATDAARDARAAWHRVAGPHCHPREAPAVVAQLTALRAAQLQLLRALIADRMTPRSLPLPPADSHPFEVAWPEPAAEATGAIDLRTPPRGLFSFWRRVRP